MGKFNWRAGILGRCPTFENPQELLELFADYIGECIDKNELANIAGFRSNKGIPKSTLSEYERKPAFSCAFELIEDVLHDKTLNNSTIDPTTKKLVLQSKFGYRDQSTNVNLNAEATGEDAKTIQDRLLDKLKDM